MGVTQCCIVVVLRMREWMARWNRIRSAVRPSSNELETIDEKEPSRQKHAADPLPGVGLTQPPTDGLADRMSAAELQSCKSCRGGTSPSRRMDEQMERSEQVQGHAADQQHDTAEAGDMAVKCDNVLRSSVQWIKIPIRETFPPGTAQRTRSTRSRWSAISTVTRLSMASGTSAVQGSPEDSLGKQR